MRVISLILIACLAAGCEKPAAELFFGASIERLSTIQTNTEAIRTEQGDKLRDIDAGVKDLVEGLLPTDEPPQAVAQVPAFSFNTDLLPSLPQGMELHCYPIRARSGNTTTSCTAVAVGEADLVTVAHLTSGLSAPRVEVEIDGQWKPASFRPRGGDLASVTVSGVSLKQVNRRKAEYREVAFVYGLASKRLQRGLIVNSDAVSLDPGETGTINGDSGGGVFGSDGLLIGTLRSRHSGEKRLIYFEPATASQSEGMKSPATSAPAPQPNCINGQCPRPAVIYQAPAVSTPRSRRSARGT